jgi:outer membrane protein assembly factor BamB
VRGGGRIAAPLVALAGVVAALVALRVARRPPPPAVTTSGHPDQARAAGADAGGGVIAHAAKSDGETSAAPRTLHADLRRTNRARGVRGPTEAHVAWTAHLGGAIEAQVVASPDASVLYVASLDGALTALDAKTGATKWTLPLGDRAYATPCVADDGTIYAGSDAKRFVAVTPAGAALWKLEVDGEADTGCAITNGRIVFAAGPHVYAVRRGGDVAWRFDAKKKVFTTPAVADDGAIAFGSQDHRAYALTPAGALAWSADLGADVDGGPAIGDDGDVYAGTDAGELVRLGGKTGEVAWRTPLGGFVRGPLAITRDGDLLAGVYGPTPRLARVSPSGVVVASVAVPGTGAREFGVHGGALEDATGALYFGAQDDRIRAIGPAGTWEWAYEAGGDVDAPLTLLPLAEPDAGPSEAGTSSASSEAREKGALVAATDDGNVILFTP